MVNRPLTSRFLWSRQFHRIGKDGEGQSRRTRRSEAGRQPSLAVRALTELLAGIGPGKSPINLSVGEPRHPIPGFVGSVLTEHVARFGRYPTTRGTDRFRAG